VTHDPDEAMRIADRIALLDRGCLIQYDTPESLYARPATLFVARFFSDIAAVRGVGAEGFLETRLGRFAAPGLAPGEPAFACVRPRQLKLGSVADGVEGRVVGTEYLGDCRHLMVAVPGIDAPVAVCVEPEDDSRGAAGPGTVVHVVVRNTDVPVVADSGGLPDRSSIPGAALRTPATPPH
jgi:iron(III) transport system ATP-binding protein